MDHFTYIDGTLHAESVPVTRIAEAVGTPFYCYSTATLTRHYRVFADALAAFDPLICFATKANGNIAVLRTLGDLGAGADVVSEGEMRAALAAGIPPERIVFSGVGKTAGELTAALDAGIFQINVESESELRMLSGIAAARGIKAPVAVRVNPHVDARTHEKISTGGAEHKFGIDWTMAHGLIARAARLEGIALVGLAMHIGSQITDLAPYENAFARLRDLIAMLHGDGILIERVDLGGGLGVPYHRDAPAPPPPDAYAAVIDRSLGDLIRGVNGRPALRLILEPGRLIAANAGILVTRVIHVKDGSTKRFIIVDAAMNDLLRPSLYSAHHDILPVRAPEAGASMAPVDVVGPVCETGDSFAVNRSMPPLAADDLLAVMTAGAYGAVMASSYNARPLVPETMVRDEAFAIVRRRPTYDEMAALEQPAHWQSG